MNTWYCDCRAFPRFVCFTRNSCIFVQIWWCGKRTYVQTIIFDDCKQNFNCNKFKYDKPKMQFPLRNIQRFFDFVNATIGLPNSKCEVKIWFKLLNLIQKSVRFFTKISEQIAYALYQYRITCIVQAHLWTFYWKSTRNRTLSNFNDNFIVSAKVSALATVQNRIRRT